jgi:hypothetical protein
LELHGKSIWKNIGISEDQCEIPDSKALGGGTELNSKASGGGTAKAVPPLEFGL